MSLFFWISLAILLLVVLGGGAFAVTRTVATWRVLRGFGRTTGVAIADLERRRASLEEHASRTTRAGERLSEAVARLQVSLAEAAVLADAAGEVRSSVAVVGATIPHK